MPRIARDLPQVRSEERTAVVRDAGGRVVEHALAAAVDDFQAQHRVLARPVLRIEAADFAEQVRADEQVARRQVVLVAHRGGNVAPPRAGRDERIFVDPARHLRRERVFRRRDGRTADRADRGVGKVRDRGFEPTGERTRVVVEEGDDLPARLADAAVALVGGKDLAGRDFAHPVRPRFARGGVRQDDRLQRRIRFALAAERGDAFAQHRARGGTRDHGRHGRRRIRHRTRIERAVVAENARPVEDRGRVDEHVAHVLERERAGLARVVQVDRRFLDAHPRVAQDREHLQVEREALRDHAVERVAERRAREELHPCLRVVDRKTHEQLHEPVVDAARDAPAPRVVHVRLGVHLGADHDVRARPRHAAQEVARAIGAQFQVAVEKQHVRPSARAEPRHERGALAAVLRQDDRAHGRAGRGGGAGERGVRSVARTVVHRHELERDPLRAERRGARREVALDLRSEPVARQHDRKQRKAGGTLRRNAFRGGGAGRFFGFGVHGPERGGAAAR